MPGQIGDITPCVRFCTTGLQTPHTIIRSRHNMKDHEQAEIVDKLSSLILKAVPKAQVVEKYGGTLYTLKPEEKESQFCGIFQFENHVQLVFS